MRRLGALLLLTALGCATDGGGRTDTTDEEEEAIGNTPGLAPGRGEVLPSVEYGDSAEENYNKGEAAYADGEYLAAQRYYTFVRAKFPYSRFSVLADLRVGECQFKRKRYVEAIDSFQNFVRLHPTHSEVPRALFMTGKAYFEQIPSNFFLLPPAHEKDQSAVRDAERALTAYIDRFPKHTSIDDAKEMRADVRKRLLAHERYAADFYSNLGRDRAYVGRLEVIRRDFADVGLDAELLWEIAEVWNRVGENERAISAARQLTQLFPKSDEAADAQDLLARTSTTGK